MGRMLPTKKEKIEFGYATKFTCGNCYDDKPELLTFDEGFKIRCGHCYQTETCLNYTISSAVFDWNSINDKFRRKKQETLSDLRPCTKTTEEKHNPPSRIEVLFVESDESVPPSNRLEIGPIGIPYIPRVGEHIDMPEKYIPVKYIYEQDPNQKTIYEFEVVDIKYRFENDTWKPEIYFKF